MALERKYTSDGLSLVANKLVGDFRVVIMNTLVLALMRMVLFI
jgi:hypothetical protein